MKPSDLSLRLRKIAASIEASSKPSRNAVASDLRRILSALKEAVTVTVTFEGLEEAGGWYESELLDDMLTGVENVVKSCGGEVLGAEDEMMTFISDRPNSCMFAIQKFVDESGTAQAAGIMLSFSVDGVKGSVRPSRPTPSSKCRCGCGCDNPCNDPFGSLCKSCLIGACGDPV